MKYKINLYDSRVDEFSDCGFITADSINEALEKYFEDESDKYFIDKFVKRITDDKYAVINEGFDELYQLWFKEIV